MKHQVILGFTVYISGTSMSNKKKEKKNSFTYIKNHIWNFVFVNGSGWWMLSFSSHSLNRSIRNIKRIWNWMSAEIDIWKKEKTTSSTCWNRIYRNCHRCGYIFFMFIGHLFFSLDFSSILRFPFFYYRWKRSWALTSLSCT